MSDNRVEEVMSSFRGRVNCSQAVFSVYGQDLGIDRETCLKIASMFGGGIDGTGNVCGAVTGALMAVGLKHHDVKTKDYKNQKSRGITRDFIQQFNKRNGTIICRDLIDHDLYTAEDIEQAFKTDAFKNCPKYVRDAAEILEKIL
jgi:C_GCAxxG_C_C family probable redox protein